MSLSSLNIGFGRAENGRSKAGKNALLGTTPHNERRWDSGAMHVFSAQESLGKRNNLSDTGVKDSHEMVNNKTPTRISFLLKIS